jgi:phage-related protein (TIGR01555 family)
VFDKSQISWQEADLNRDFLSPNFALPEFYTITSFKNSADTSILKIHASRCKVLDGITTSHLKRRTNLGWGDSVLQACYDSLRYYGIVAESSAEIITDFIQVIIKINGLADKMVKDVGRQQIADRGDSIDESRSSANLIFLDSVGEDYEKKSSSVAGLADLWDRFSESVCAATGYPATRLFGRSPGGLNSTGDSDLKNYYDLVSAYRSDEIEPIINWILNFITHQQEWGSDKDIEWSFASLVEQTPLEDAKLKKLYAEIDWGYIDRGAIDAGNTWQERFGKGEFQENIQLKQLERDADFTDLEELEIISDLKKEESQIKEESNTERKAKKVLDSVFNSL